jgi:hypothetical protein
MLLSASSDNIFKSSRNLGTRSKTLLFKLESEAGDVKNAFKNGTVEGSIKKGVPFYVDSIRSSITLGFSLKFYCSTDFFNYNVLSKIANNFGIFVRVISF